MSKWLLFDTQLDRLQVMRRAPVHSSPDPELAPEIEITPEMIEAGSHALLDADYGSSSGLSTAEVVESVISRALSAAGFCMKNCKDRPQGPKSASSAATVGALACGAARSTIDLPPGTYLILKQTRSAAGGWTTVAERFTFQNGSQWEVVGDRLYEVDADSAYALPKEETT
jgi:hypothetical protein